ncbi:protein jagged-1a-like [Pecten maximus]|uniref:protein jagged-1a-like n=1 Tax=Pecten maximus TaxID=6579 RepID=UPI001458ECB4|nr:protein jagged-1a-like [Pecten maximus]
MGWCLIFYIAIGICQVVGVNGSGTGLVRLIGFSRPPDQASTGSKVDLCVRPALAKQHSRCLYGRTTLHLATDNRFMFESESGKIANSLFFHFKSLSTGLMLAVGDVDGTDEERSGSVGVILTRQPVSSGTTRISAMTRQGINLTIEYTLVCDEYYYGDCATYCHPDIPKYNCDRTGQRICLTGWTGDLCDIRDDTCGTNPCRHGGTCTNIPHNHHFCMCTPEWTGHNCETPVHL